LLCTRASFIVVDQLEIDLFKRSHRSASELLRTHRLQLEDVCRLFSSPRILSSQSTVCLDVHTNDVFDLVSNADTLRDNTRLVPAIPMIEHQSAHVSHESDSTCISSKKTDDSSHDMSTVATKRNVSFAEQIDIIDLQHDEIRSASSSQATSIDSFKIHPPLASEILVDQMDSNLRMLIVKELSKTAHIQRPLSRMSQSHRSFRELFTHVYGFE
jgi:hypothetical protein